MDDKNLDDLAEQAMIAHLDRRSLLMLEAAVGCLLDTRSTGEAAELLREMAEHLEDFG